MRWLIGVALTGGLVAAIFGWRHFDLRQPTHPAASAPVLNEITVTAAPVKVGAIRRQIEAVGSLRSDESVIIRPEIAGRISRDPV